MACQERRPARAYLPAASMGTAIEMWEASRAGRPVAAITPLRHNWVTNLSANTVCPSLVDFHTFVEAGGLERVIAERRGGPPTPVPSLREGAV